MQQFKALLIKEFWTHKKSATAPMFVLIALYLGIGLIIFISYLKMGSEGVVLGSTTIGSDDIMDMFTYWSIGYFNLLLPMSITMIVYLGMTTSMINDDYKQKCTLFHCSFPVSIMSRILAKLVFLLSLTLAMSIVFSIINFILIGIIMFRHIDFIPYFKYYSIGSIQCSIIFNIHIFLILGFVWMFSAFFKEKTFTKTFLALMIAYSFLFFFAYAFGFTKSYNAFVGNIFTFFIPNSGFSSFGDIMPEYSIGVREMIFRVWANILRYKVLSRFMVGGMMFGIGTYILSKREVV